MSRQESPKLLGVFAIDCKGVNNSPAKKTVTVLVSTFDDGKHEVSCPKLGVDEKKGRCQNGATGATPLCAYLSPQSSLDSRPNGD